MGSRWFNSVVVLFWLSTMTWLVVAKVVPPLRRGDPPSYHSMYFDDKDSNDEQPVGWEMTLNGKPLGFAVNKLARMGTGVTEVRGRIHFDRIPLQEFSPTWANVLLQTISLPPEATQMDVFSSLEIDPLGHLTRFRSALRVAGMRESVVITGRAQASRLLIDVESGQFQSPQFEAFLPRDALVADELSPQTRITGLQLNQEWTVPVFSPLRPPKNPVEILQAKVESRDPIEWEGKVTGAFRVVYRADSGSVFSSSREPRGKLWVRDDGTVLKQEVNVLGSQLVFTRMNAQKSLEIAAQADRDDEEHRRIRKENWMRWRMENGGDRLGDRVGEGTGEAGRFEGRDWRDRHRGMWWRGRHSRFDESQSPADSGDPMTPPPSSGEPQTGEPQTGEPQTVEPISAPEEEVEVSTEDNETPN